MDTPERNKIGNTSVSKFEDSPVFNYINSLSPIKPVKSTHITQALNPLSFVALPSVFTSPHVISRKESRFLRRHNKYSDPADPELPSADGNKNYTSEGGALKVSQLSNNSTGPEENFDSGVSMSNLSIYLLNNSPNSIEELQRLNCCTAIHDGDPVNPDVIKVDGLSEFADASDLILSNGENHHENGSSEPIREEIYDWEGLIGDGADLLIFASPSGSEAIRPMQKPIEPSAEFSPTIMGVLNDSTYKQIKPILNPVNSHGPREAEEPSSHSAETRGLDEHRKLDIVTYSNSEKCVTHRTGEKIDNEAAIDSPIHHEPISTMHRGLRRRCLDFEKVGTYKQNSSEGSICSSTMSHGDENLASNNKQLLHSKSEGSSSMYVFNGIGLHLNAVAASSNGYQDVNHENLLHIRQPSLSSTIALYPPPTTEEESLLASAVSQKDADPSENTVQMDEDASHGSPYVLAGQDINQNSPKKKRPREFSEESESCKRCNCKKSKCLKLYCECFAAGVYCIETCSCQECFNKPIHKDTVLATRKQIEARNPLAFAPKVIRNSETVLELGEESTKTPASARHKRGCNCKKSSCLKKYCECYQGGVGCSISCRCEGCKNAFGIKDGSVLVELETEQKEDDETEASLKSVAKKPSPLGNEIQNNEELNPGLLVLLPTTPLQLCRPVDPLPFSSRPKLCSSFLITGSSTGQKLENLSILGPQVKFDKSMKAVSEDEMPEILRTSPNSKRVSPPKSGLVSSRIPRTGRKLILQAIPSFPSLTQ